MKRKIMIVGVLLLGIIGSCQAATPRPRVANDKMPTYHQIFNTRRFKKPLLQKNDMLEEHDKLHKPAPAVDSESYFTWAAFKALMYEDYCTVQSGLRRITGYIYRLFIGASDQDRE